MPIDRPYRRTCRQFVDGSYTEGGRWQYMLHPTFAQAPSYYIRAFLLLLKDLQDLFDYIEPADKNLGCFSYRIHALLLRACVEVEANCKAILTENDYTKAGDMHMGDYQKIDKTHLLSSYQVKVPTWSGNQDTRTPFLAWSTNRPLPWYQAYNQTKHDRHMQFESATFEHLIDACCGVLVLLSAQFETNDFSPGNILLASPNVYSDGMESGIGGFFRVKFPDNWPMELRYDFDWQVLKHEPDPFQAFDYTTIT